MALARGSERSNVFALITPKRNAAAVLIMSCLLMVGSLCAAETEAPAPDSASETTPSEPLPPERWWLVVFGACWFFGEDPVQWP